MNYSQPRSRTARFDGRHPDDIHGATASFREMRCTKNANEGGVRNDKVGSADALLKQRLCIAATESVNKGKDSLLKKIRI